VCVCVCVCVQACLVDLGCMTSAHTERVVPRGVRMLTVDAMSSIFKVRVLERTHYIQREQILF